MGNWNDRPVAMQEHYDILEQNVPLAERDCDLLETSIYNYNVTGYKNSSCQAFTIDGFRAFVSVDEMIHHRTAKVLCEVNLAIWDYVAPWYLLIGVVGNAIAMTVWLQPQLRRHSNGMSVTLVALASCDIVVLCSGFLRHYVRKTSYIDRDIQSYGTFLCKFTEFVVYYTICFSSWLVSTIAVERCVTIVCYDNRKACCICWPRSNKQRRRTKQDRNSYQIQNGSSRNRRLSISCHFACCRNYTRRPNNSVRVVLSCLALMCLLLYGHIFWTRVYDENERTCRNIAHEFQHFMQDVWPYIDMIFAVLLPHTVTIVASSIIIVHLRCVNRRKFLAESSAPNTNANAANLTSATVASPQSPIADQPKATRKLVNRSFVARHSLRIVFTLACICIFYVVCQLPAKLWLILRPISARRSEHAHVHFYNRIAWTVLVMIQYTAHISNFFIYSLSNEKFRKGLLTLAVFGGRKRKQQQQQQQLTPRSQTVRNMTNTMSPEASQRNNVETYSTVPMTNNKGIVAPGLLLPVPMSHRGGVIDEDSAITSAADVIPIPIPTRLRNGVAEEDSAVTSSVDVSMLF